MLVAAVVVIIDVVEVVVVVVQVVAVVYWSVLQVRTGCCYVLLWTMTARRVMKRRTIEGWVM